MSKISRKAKGIILNQARRLRLKTKAAYSLIELIIVMVIIGILVSAGMMELSHNAEDAKITVAKSDVRNLMGAIVLYKADVGSVPTETDSTTLCPKLKQTTAGKTGSSVGPWMSTCPKQDPWGGTYKFVPDKMIVYTTVPDSSADSNGNKVITSKDLSSMQPSEDPA